MCSRSVFCWSLGHLSHNSGHLIQFERYLLLLPFIDSPSYLLGVCTLTHLFCSRYRSLPFVNILISPFNTARDQSFSLANNTLYAPTGYRWRIDLECEGEGSASLRAASMSSQADSSSVQSSAQDEDDWTAVTDPGERRKIQNRIAQRKFRQSFMSYCA